MPRATKTPRTRQTRTGALASGNGSAFESIFGKSHTKIEVSDEEPTMHLRWRKGVLEQLWDITERHMHYSGTHYNHSTHHRREKWRPVEGTPNSD